MITPFGNYAKIEVVDEFKGLVRNDPNEQKHMGILRDCTVSPFHLTESGGFRIDDVAPIATDLTALIGKVVYYQEHADSGRKFTEDGVDYVMIPWYRIYGYEGEATK